MPTVTLNKSALHSYIGKKITDVVLVQAVTQIGCSVESSEGKDIQVEVGPNRPDLLSEPGLSRALSSYLGVRTGLRKYTIKKGSYKVTVEQSVKDIRGFTACAVVKGLVFDEEKIKEIIQIQEKLHVTYGRNRKKVAIGVYPLEKITFPVFFRADDPNKISFVPLEGNKKMTGLEILRNHPTGKEYAHLLEGVSKFPYFVDAKNEILSMPPIINSHTVGKISADTKDVFVECSGFNQEVLDNCLNMIVVALADMGGQIYSVELTNTHAKVQKQSPSLEPSKMDLDISYVNKRLGLSLTKKEIKGLLERMGFGYDGAVLIPAYRSDILHQIDLVEDIAIAFGFDSLTPSIPSVASIGSLTKSTSYKQKIAALMSGLGLFETNTYCLIGENKKESVKLMNSVSEGYDYLRVSMLDSLLLAIQQNRNREYPQGFFEIGKTFRYGANEIVETESLGCIFAGPSADYTYARQILEYILDAAQITYSFRKSSSEMFMAGRSAELIIEGVSVGRVGLINPALLESFGIEMPICGFEVNFDVFIKNQ